MAPHSRDEVFAASTEYFNGDALAANVWVDKYAIQAGSDFYELTPADMHDRMADCFAEIERRYPVDDSKVPLLSDYGREVTRLSRDAIRSYFDRFAGIIPQGSVMAGLGNDRQFVSLSNCIVLPPIHDSYGGVMFTDQQLTQLYKRRCGIGVDISTLRPEGCLVTNAARSSTGAVSFMHRFSHTTREVGQNSRRGALMITIDVRHPDVEKFIAIKQDRTSVTGANVSVKVTDEFMKAAIEDRDFELRWPVDSDSPSVRRTVQAKDVWLNLVAAARNFAEPGIMFWDTHNNFSPSHLYPGFENITTNPCGEVTLPGYGSCRLILSNWFSFVDRPFTDSASVKWDAVYRTSYDAQRLADDLVDAEVDSIERIIEKIKRDPEPDHIKDVELRTWRHLRDAGIRARRTGTGLTGLGDMLAALGMAYDAEESVALVERVAEVKCRAELDCSVDLAIMRGTFDGFDPKIEKKSKFIEFLQGRMPDVVDRMMIHGRRNISWSTVAPTGSVSLCAQTTGGCEPLTFLTMKRKRKVGSDMGNLQDGVELTTDEVGDTWEEYEFFHPKLKMWMDENPGLDASESPYAGSTCEEIDWRRRIQMQAALQRFTSHSISSTLNLRKDVPVDEVRGIYEMGWQSGLKGVTVYRSGSRDGVIKNADEKVLDASSEIIETMAPKRPVELECDVHVSRIKGEEWAFFVGTLDGKPYEVFGGARSNAYVPSGVHEGWIVKRGHGETRDYDFYRLLRGEKKLEVNGLRHTFEETHSSYTRLISLALRHGVPIRYICDQLRKINAEEYESFERGCIRVLKKYIKDGVESSENCPHCSAKFVYQEGCTICLSCGHSVCMM